MFYVKQSTAGQELPVLIVDSGDGYTPETEITEPTVKIAKATGAFANANDGTWAEDAYGWYTVQLNGTDTNTLGLLKLHVEKTGCRNFDDYGYVLPANVYDSMFSTDKLQVDLTQVAGAAVDTASAQVGANVVSSSKTDSVGTQVGTVDSKVVSAHTVTDTAVGSVGVLVSTVDSKVDSVGSKITATGQAVTKVDTETLETSVIRNDDYTEDSEHGRFEYTLTSVDLTGVKEIWYYVKGKIEDDDADAVLTLTLTDSEIAIIDAGAGEIEVATTAAQTTDLDAPLTYVYAIKVKNADDKVSTHVEGDWVLSAEVVKATS